MTRIIVAEALEASGRDLSVERSILGPDVELVRESWDGDEERIAATCREADILLTELVPLDRSLLTQMQRCQLISVAGTGYSHIDLDAAIDAGISVCAIDDYCTDEVADHVILLMLAVCRRLTEYHAQVQEQNLWRFDTLAGLPRLRDMTLGIVGFGKIGRAVAHRAKGFGMRLLAYDRHPDQRAAQDLDVRLCELPTLFRESDVISLNCSLSADNEYLIDADAIAQMARSPVLINCARGALIDEGALADALDNGQISGAGLDVLCDESADITASKMTGRRNVILTPHVAFYSDASILESRKVSASNIRHFLDGNHELVNKYVYQAKK
jgi:D-3-phosphoglycerate dehydrogenase